MYSTNDALATGVTSPSRSGWPTGFTPSPAREIALADIWFIIWKRKLAVLLFASCIVLVVVLYTFLTKPVYESVAQIRIDASQHGALGLEDIVSEKLADDNEGGRLQTEATILESRTVAMQVIKNLDLAHKADFVGKKMVISKAETDPAKMDPKDRESLLKTFNDSRKVEVLPKTRVVEIRFRSSSPSLATDAVNGIVDAYTQRNFESRYEGAVQVSDWLSKQMEDLRADASAAQERLAEFQKQNNIIGTDENNNIVTDRLRLLNSQLADAEADRILKEARYRLASSGNPELIAAVVPSTALQVLRTQEAELKSQYSQLDSKYGIGYPKVRELQSQLQRLDHSISDEVSNVGQRLHEEYRASSDSESMLRHQFENQKQEAFKLNGKAVQFATLKHEVESSQDLLDTLQLKLKEAGLVAGLASADISIVDRGLIPARPVFPKKVLMLSMGLIFGVFGGVVFAFIMESLDDSLGTLEEVEAASSLPALAAVPFVESRQLPRSSANKLTHELDTAALRSGTLLSEAYQVICNSLLLASADRPPRLIVVTSALPGEGKSTTSCNLAITLAQRGRKVLLLDTDMRRSTLPFQLGLDSTTACGLSSILTGAAEEQEAIREPIEELPNMDVILAGPQSPCPTQLLVSNKMNMLMDKWSAEYDHVVVDTTPVLYVADSLPLAARADAVLLVVRSGRSRKKAFNRTCELLLRAKAHLVGVVVNAAHLHLEPYAHSYYGRVPEAKSEEN